MTNRDYCPDPPPVPVPVPTPTATSAWSSGYSAQAAKAIAWKYDAMRGKQKGNADMAYSIMRKLYGATVRSRPLVISHVMTPAGAPKVGVAETSSPEQYAPDGQTITSTPQKWRSNNVDIAGATASSYVPVVGDVGRRLSVVVTPSTADRAGIKFQSDATAKVAA